MNKNSTPFAFRFILRLAAFLTVLAFSADNDARAQCNNIDGAGFTPADTAHCGYPLSIGFQGNISVDSTPVLLLAQNASPNFKSAFSFTFPTQNNGCYYYLEIAGQFTLWSNTNNYFDAFGMFNISTNQLISQGVSNNLSISPPLFVLPAAYSPAHVYRYYYQGNGANVTVSFSDNQLSDNSGAMTFSWHVVPCFSTLWDFGDGATASETDVSHTYSAPGAYPVTLTVTSELDGCSESYSGMVNVMLPASTSISATICAGESYPLGNNAYTETGSYTEMLATYQGCDSTVTLDLLALNPSASVLAPSVIDCNNATVALDGSGSSTGQGISYQWTGPGPGCIVGDGSQPTVMAACPGTYTLQVTQTAADGTQCSATAQATVLEDTEAPLLVLADVVDYPCEASELELTAVVTANTANLSYNWQTASGNILSGADTTVLVIGSPGVYQFEVTNQDNGCSASGATIVTGALPMEIDWEAIAPNCQNPSGTIDIQVASGGNPPFLYSIDGGSQFQGTTSFAGLAAGQYGIVVQDAKGCETETEIVVFQDLIPVSVETGPGASIFAGESWPLAAWVNLPASQIDSIRWTPAGSLSCADCLDPVASPVATTEYLVEVWDVSGCYDNATVLVEVAGSSIFAPNVFSPNGDGVNDEFMLYGRSGAVAQVRSLLVFSKWGQLVYQGSDFPLNATGLGWDGNCGDAKMSPDTYAWLAEISYPDGRQEVLKGNVTLVR